MRFKTLVGAQGDWYCLWHGRLHRTKMPRFLSAEVSTAQVRAELDDEYKYMMNGGVRLKEVELIIH